MYFWESVWTALDGLTFMLFRLKASLVGLPALQRQLIKTVTLTNSQLSILVLIMVEIRCTLYLCVSCTCGL